MKAKRIGKTNQLANRGKEPVYLDMMNDYGFKRVFGRQRGAWLLLNMLKAFLPDEFRDVTRVEHMPTELFGDADYVKRVVFDLLCSDDQGNRTIVEMQRVTQEFFAERAITYNSRAISDSLERGDREFDIPNVISFTILEHKLLGYENSPEYFHVFRYRDQYGRPLSGKSTICFLELGKFSEWRGDQLKDIAFANDKEKWAYVIKHVMQMDEQDLLDEDPVFRVLLNACKLSTMNHAEKEGYERSLWEYDDVKNSIRYARKEGYELGKKRGERQGRGVGIMQGRREVAERLLAQGLAPDRVADLCELPMVDVCSLLK